MASLRSRKWLVAALFAVAFAPLAFYLGVIGTVGLQHLRGPAPGGGEGVQADAYAAILIGGPIGAVVGSALAAWISFRFAERLSWPVIVGTLALLVASAWALQIFLMY